MINPVNHPFVPLVAKSDPLTSNSLWVAAGSSDSLSSSLLDALEQAGLAVRVTRHLVMMMMMMEKWNRDPRDSAAIEI